MARQVVPQEAGLLHRKAPVGFIELLGPMKKLVHHHGSSPLSNSLNSAFGDARLVMSSNTTVGDRLTQAVDLGAEQLRVEGSIVGAIALDLDTEIARGSLEGAFAN